MENEHGTTSDDQPEHEPVEMPQVGDGDEIHSLIDAADRILDSADCVDAEQFLRRNQQRGGQ